MLNKTKLHPCCLDYHYRFLLSKKTTFLFILTPVERVKFKPTKDENVNRRGSYLTLPVLYMVVYQCSVVNSNFVSEFIDDRAHPPALGENSFRLHYYCTSRNLNNKLILNK